MSKYDEYLDYINKADKTNITVVVTEGTRYEIAKNYVLGYNDGRLDTLNFFMREGVSGYESISKIKVSKLIELLSNYSDDDTVELNMWGLSDCPSVELSVNGDTILSDSFQ